MRKILLTCVMLSLPACAPKEAIVTIPPARCADLVPSAWAKGVDAAPVPANTDDGAWLGKPLTDAIAAALIAPWAAAYVSMSGQLEKANGRTADAMAIMRECEKQVNAARTGN